MRLAPSLAIAALVALACTCETTVQTGSSTGGKSSSSGGGNGSSSGGNPGSPIGSRCGGAARCLSGLTCLAQLPDGYCSAACNPGSCPTGAGCIEALPGEFACGLSCASDADCMRTGYSCDPTCLVCIPTIAVGQVSCPPNFAGGGGHLPDGGACGSLPGGAGSLSWTASVDTSASPATSDEIEGAGAAAPTDAGLVVVAYMVSVDGDAGSTIGVSLSRDNGKTFTVETPPVGIADNDTVAYDPSVAVDPFGQFYLAWGGYYAASNGNGQGEVWVATSHGDADGGFGWNLGHDVLGTGDIPSATSGGGGADKPAIAINPSTFVPFVVTGTFSGSYGGLGPYEIRLIVGGQGGFGWQPSLEVDDSPHTLRQAWRDLPAIAFDNAGDAYVAWAEYNGAQGAQPIIADQVTGTEIVGYSGSSIWFSEVQVVPGGLVPGTNVQVSLPTDNVVLDVPKIAAAPDGSRLYVAYTGSSGTANVTGINVARSGDHGTTWKNGGVGGADGCSTNFHPAIFLDSQNRLWVSWVSNVDGEGSVLYSVSTDQGTSFSAPALLSDVPFSFNTQLAIPSSLGGYQALFGGNGTLFSLWTGAPTNAGIFPPSHVFLQAAKLP